MALRSPTQTHSFWGEHPTSSLPSSTEEVQVGDTAFDSTIGQLVVCTASLPAVVWEPVGSRAGVRSYGVATLAYNGLSAPASEAAIGNAVQSNGGNVALWDYFDTTYYRCKVRLRFSDWSDAPYLDVTRTFANRAEITTFVNDNRTSESVLVEMEVFDVIDGNMLPPPNVYAKNRLYSGLISRNMINREGRYWGNKPDSCYYATYPSGSASLRALLLSEMWSKIHPSVSMPAPGDWTAAEFGCFWLSTNRLRQYDMPQFSGTLAIPDGPRSATTTRYVRLFDSAPPTSASTEPRASGPDLLSTQWGTLSETPQVFYGALNPGANGFLTWSTYQAFQNNAIQIGRGWSVIAGYPLYRQIPETTQWELSVLIKPVGVDSFFFDTFDTDRYQLEAVGTYRNDGRLMLQQVPVAYQDYAHRSTAPVLVNELYQTFRPTRRSVASGRAGYGPGRVRFQYRDLLTNRVSSYSPAGIEPVVRKRARPFALMVRDRPEIG